MKRNTANILYNGFFVGIASLGGGIYGSLILSRPVLGSFIAIGLSTVAAVALGIRYDDRKIK